MLKTRAMRIIALSTLSSFWAKHHETEVSLRRWAEIAKAAEWKNVAEVKASFPKAKALNGERVRFEIAGGNYGLIVAFKFDSQIAFIKLVGTHAEYDRINTLTISQF